MLHPCQMYTGRLLILGALSLGRNGSRAGSDRIDAVFPWTRLQTVCTRTCESRAPALIKKVACVRLSGDSPGGSDSVGLREFQTCGHGERLLLILLNSQSNSVGPARQQAAFKVIPPEGPAPRPRHGAPRAVVTGQPSGVATLRDTAMLRS